MPPTIHLNNLRAPNLIDVAVIKEEVEKDESLHKIKVELEGKEEDHNSKYLVK